MLDTKRYTEIANMVREGELTKADIELIQLIESNALTASLQGRKMFKLKLVQEFVINKIRILLEKGLYKHNFDVRYTHENTILFYFDGDYYNDEIIQCGKGDND